MIITGGRLLSVIYLVLFSLAILFVRQRFNEFFFGPNSCEMTFMWRRVMLMVEILESFL